MTRSGIQRWAIHFILGGLLCSGAGAEFAEEFDGPEPARDPTGHDGWAFFTGDGAAVMDFSQGEGFASIAVDATADERNVWWALIRREATGGLDLKQLNRPGYELRIEARVRSSHAPRRVNLHLNTQRTTDFHSHLMEFDLPVAERWHTISMTTRDFDAGPGDKVFGQLALMDWGQGKYRVDVDYLKVRVVESATAGPDAGEAAAYHPPIPEVMSYERHVGATEDCIIDSAYPEMNFNDWHALDAEGKTTLLTVSGSRWVILRWDLSRFAGRRIPDYGLLELTVYGVQRGKDVKDFGMVRVAEIPGGDADWDQDSVTYESFCAGDPIDEVVNPQMIVDVEPGGVRGEKLLIPINRAVLQRMMNRRTKGLAIRPLGAIAASFYAMENGDNSVGPRLHFTVNE